MYSKIMVPVDLGHTDMLGKALATAADLAGHFGVSVVYVGVGEATPSAISHNPAEFNAKLEAFAAAEAARHGITATAHSVISHDPAVDLDASLIKAIAETGADLVVMQSHVPGLAEHLWPSHGGKLAGHAAASVFLVR